VIEPLLVSRLSCEREFSVAPDDGVSQPSGNRVRIHVRADEVAIVYLEQPEGYSARRRKNPGYVKT
jgi:hypothetical protein